MRRSFALLTLFLILGVLPFPGLAAEPETGGRSALLMDCATGTVLFESNAHEPLAPASVTKVMTMLLIMEAIDSGAIGWEDAVTASEAAAAKGGSQVYLKVGETMTVSDMLKSIAVSSANDCACAMAEHIAGSESAFVERMNTRAQELGMKDTHFVNCTGLDDSEDAKNHRTSAHDIAVMSRELLKEHPDIKRFTTIWMDTVRNGAFGLSNTNKMIRFYNGATGLKTGFTSGAGYCLSSSAQRDGMELIAVVMGAETSQIRFQSCRSMLDFGFANYALVQPEITEVPAVPVRLGIAAQVYPKLGDDPSVLVTKAEKGSLQTRIDVVPELTAPVHQGQQLGTMRILSGDRELCKIPLIAENSVDRLSFLQLFSQVLRKVSMSANP
ncbi:MAG: D-alanyl-D-alanine carboxypeptidase [Oscillospiraceae bacterium]|nr:D-alanyl-D-alanine carboxypeptidase [Oscillospiraceae bacterium]